MKSVKCLIIGGGPAGYTAAVYAARAGLSPLLCEGPEPGGQLVRTSTVENFPGFPEGVDAVTLMMNMKAQALRLGAEIVSDLVTDVDFSRRPFTAVLGCGEEVEAGAVIVATGAKARYLGIPSEAAFIGNGVSACATCDGFFCRGKDVAVVGGGDTACSEALYLADICRKVYLVVRRDVLRASDILRQRVAGRDNVEVLYECQVREIKGDVDGVSSMVVSGRNGLVFEKEINGLFPAIGHSPESSLFSKWLETDAAGFIKTFGGTQQTSVEGVFAAGDVQDPVYMQAVTAAASGCRAAIDAERFLKK